MPHPVLEHLSRGSFIFLRGDPNEIRKILPSADDLLPNPQKIFLADETATPVIGFPVFRSRASRRLSAAMGEYLEVEQAAQVAAVTRGSFDSRAYGARWEAYRGLLAHALENTIRSSTSYDYASLFWLAHSLEIARSLAAIPKHLRQSAPTVGRDHGDEIKYRMLSKWLDRVTTLSYDLAHEMAGEMEEEETSLFPGLLGLMRDNVLLLTEDYISPDLIELDGYFRGCLRQDGRDLRQRLKNLEHWHSRYLASDALLRAASLELLGVDPDGESRRALFHSGYVPFLRRHSAYDPDKLLGDSHLQVWESLLQKLKEFEIVHSLRKMLVPIEVDGGKLLCRDRSSNTTWVGGPPVLELSSATRPIDFHAPWVVNPAVQRFGLVYDITDFSATISTLGRAERSALDTAFRMSAQFQRKIDNLASALGIRLEKYLGDGAFYSGRSSRRMLVMAIHLQRLYPRF
ncbi:MAG: hypothetical protein MI919_06030, partial [Holophagales bacterium]|nr:hypothetical protein [Holophagales bacterium]